MQAILTDQAFILLGSNIEPERNIPEAVRLISHTCTIKAVSSAYQSPPYNRPEQSDFLNAAVLMETDKNAVQIREFLRAVERDLGRERSQDKYAARSIDLDLSLLGNQVIDTPPIQIPDPDILKHAFIAVPLADLSPDFRHPLTGESLQSIADRLREKHPLPVHQICSQKILAVRKSFLEC